MHEDSKTGNVVDCDRSYDCLAATHFHGCQSRYRLAAEAADKAKLPGRVPSTLTITDSEGNRYIQAVPSPNGECHYLPLADGSILVVARVPREAMKPQFTLAPANIEAAEEAFLDALNEFREED